MNECENDRLLRDEAQEIITMGRAKMSASIKAKSAWGHDLVYGE
jgi:hypothetical protein